MLMSLETTWTANFLTNLVHTKNLLGQICQYYSSIHYNCCDKFSLTINVSWINYMWLGGLLLIWIIVVCQQFE